MRIVAAEGNTGCDPQTVSFPLELSSKWAIADDYATRGQLRRQHGQRTKENRRLLEGDQAPDEQDYRRRTGYQIRFRLPRSSYDKIEVNGIANHQWVHP